MLGEASRWRAQSRIIVEGSMDVRDRVGDVLFDLLTNTLSSLNHELFLYPFVSLIALRGPLRVRALVRVRWPRTGKPRRWRTPR